MKDFIGVNLNSGSNVLFSCEHIVKISQSNEDSAIMGKKRFVVRITFVNGHEEKLYNEEAVSFIDTLTNMSNLV